MAQTQVNRVIGAITTLESSLNSVNESAAEMKKSFGSMVSTESSKLFDAVKAMAASESDTIVSNARTRAESESAKIQQKGKERTTQIQSSIDTNFDDAVNYAVSEILKE